LTAPVPDTGAGLLIYTDGACRGNPGPSGAGWVICTAAGKVLGQGCAFLGHRTNNEAEYLAAAMGLTAAQQFNVDCVTLCADSQLLVRQVLGQYKVRNARILPLFRALMQVAATYRQFTARHVYREQNAAADAQANRGIDTRA
jgi:ribonuclease HI